MSRFRTALLGSAAAAMCAAALSPALSQSSDPAWLDDLGQQLQTEQECAVNYFLNMQEGQLGANRYYEARVQCVDGRMFDASRTEPDKKFTIRPCEVAVC
ncbi:hypothetical protein [Hoeflea prorocentri]|uniref:Uncharacterized protein n=1 Tax=Hoeflea prorocentri TaxID=1922333 RepID=A0A9X3ZIL8_9HYPH|nr:hypothetical protein [Hoeflea prorocentri]MCY6382153.1 hypothetical protein [Hoeflea prorocentri]MDA5399953.1 hypothetical protein [Hoeflea prorocentri]